MDSTEFKALFAEGADARRRGLSYHQNPYTTSSVEYETWIRGWAGMDSYIRHQVEDQQGEENHVQEE